MAFVVDGVEMAKLVPEEMLGLTLGQWDFLGAGHAFLSYDDGVPKFSMKHFHDGIVILFVAVDLMAVDFFDKPPRVWNSVLSLTTWMLGIGMFADGINLLKISNAPDIHSLICFCVAIMSPLKSTRYC